MALTLPQLIFEVSYGTNAWAAPAWVDETLYLQRFKCKRGKNHELQAFDAGTSDVLLLNQDRRFDPTYLAGPHGGQLLPGVRYRCRATWAGTTYPVFHNWAERWQPQWPRPARSDTRLTGVDVFKSFRKKKVTSTGYRATVLADTPVSYWRLGDPPNTPVMTDSSGNSHHGKYQGSPTLGVDGLLVADEDSALDGNNSQGWGYLLGAGGVSGTGPFTIEGWFKTSSVDAVGHVIYLQETAPAAAPPTGATEIGIYIFNGKLTVDLHNGFSLQPATIYADGNPHHFALTRSPDGVTISLWVDGVFMATGVDVAVNYGNLGSQISIGGDATGDLAVKGPNFAGVLDEIAVYNTALASSRFLARYQLGLGLWGGQLSGTRVNTVLDTVGWPTGDRLVDAGQSSLQAVTSSLAKTPILDYLQLVEKTEAGLLFQNADGKVVFLARWTQLLPPYTVSQATFGDGPGEIPYEPAPEAWLGDDDIYSEAVTTRLNGNPERAFDQTSNDKYGPSTWTATGLLMATDAEAYDRSNWVVAHYKDPASRIGTLRIRPLDDPNTIFPVVLGLEIGSRITVNRRPPGGGAAFSQAAIIESIEHEMTEDGDWITQFELGAADYTDYWVLGTSALGINTRLAY